MLRPRALVAFVAAALTSSCTRLPEPESAGAQLYAARCTTCHRAYHPQVLKFEMWKLVVGRMQGVMSRNGLPPLGDQEMNTLLDYLKRNSG
jgi:cytochrome c5